MDNEKALYLVLESMGIYPISTTDKNGTHNRTEWQDGWNAAVIEITRKRVAIAAALDEFSV